MLCQRCKKNAATENYVEIINGEKFESHLCAKCSSELYGELHSKMSENVCAWLFGSSAPKKVCPVCGTTYADYERSGLLGCASCYDVFKEELLPAIKAIQGKVEHVGKVETNNDDLGLHRRLKSLQVQLEAALREKRYVDAGKLNKRIYEINKILYGGEND
jgi:protein arginine kinase activator